MVFVDNSTKFSKSTFNGRPEVALANGYVAVSDEDYVKLCNHELCWHNGILIPYTKTADEILQEQNEKKQKRIAELKRLLSMSDYKAIKHAEGFISDEDYAEIRTQRQAWRDEINTLENELGGGGGL